MGGFIVEKIKDHRFGDILTSILTNGTLKTGDDILMIDKFQKCTERKVTRIYTIGENKEIKDKISLKSDTKIDTSTTMALKLNNMDGLMMGCKMFKFENEDERCKYERILSKMNKYINISDVKYQNPGIFLNASTLGACDALYNLCNSNDIPVAGINIGPVTKTDIMKAARILNHKCTNVADDIYTKQYSVILAYDVQIDAEIQRYADGEKVNKLSI
jgi:translation initiation factor 5B